MKLGGDTKAVLLAAGLIFIGALIVVEIAGFSVLLAGFVSELIL